MATNKLLDFLKTFGITTKTNFDLYSIADFIDIDLEVLMKNEITNSNIDLDKNYIINYQNENQKGTHWVAYTNKKYFDSFGLPPLENLDVEEYNKIQVQHYELEICGVLCIYFLYQLQYKEFDEIIEEMENLYKKISVQENEA